MREHVSLSDGYKRDIEDHYSAIMYNTNPDPKPIATQLPILGYVSIFPLILKTLPTDQPSTQLTSLLKHISNDKELWSGYGIASLSSGDMYYDHPNAPGDPPYWRGPIWMNINYLVLDSLYHYSHHLPASDTNKALSAKIYKKLRSNLVKNVMKEYKRTGYLYEQYSDKDGEAKRGHPFTGWTSLIVNIVYELY